MGMNPETHFPTVVIHNNEISDSTERWNNLICLAFISFLKIRISKFVNTLINLNTSKSITQPTFLIHLHPPPLPYNKNEKLRPVVWILLAKISIHRLRNAAGGRPGRRPSHTTPSIQTLDDVTSRRTPHHHISSPSGTPKRTHKNQNRPCTSCDIISRVYTHVRI